jgi:hypothetical protein
MLNDHPSGDNPPLIFKFVHSYPIPFVPGYLDNSPENLANHFRKLMIKSADHARTPDEANSFLGTDLPVLVYKGHDRKSKMYAYFTIAESEYGGLMKFVHADSSEYLNGDPFPDKRLTLHRNYGKTYEIYKEPEILSSKNQRNSDLSKESGVENQFSGYHHFRAWLRKHRLGGLRKYVAHRHSDGYMGHI